MMERYCAQHFQAFVDPQVPSNYMPDWLGKNVWRYFFHQRVL